MIRFTLRGDDVVRRMLESEMHEIQGKIKRFLKKWALGTIKVTKEEYLTDPGRPRFGWRVSRRTGRRYVYVPPGFYPRPKIGVITGRLRSSYGTPGEAMHDRDAIYEEGHSAHKWWVRIGTNVEYAPVLVARKYDFRERGARRFYESADMDKLVEALRRSIFG